jgi:tetratricopeptide (TPR) repeat protein
MRAHVFTDAALAKHAGRFVWLSIDTENTENAGFLERYPFEAVPTFQVLDPRTERVAYRWLGAVDAARLVERLDEAEIALREGGAEGGDAQRLYARALALDGAGRKREAAAGYEEALGAGALDEATRARAVEALVTDLAGIGRREDCVRRAIELGPTLPAGVSRANVALAGLDCAASLDEGAPGRAEAEATLEARAREALGFPGLLDDDRAGLYSALVDARERRGDDRGKQAVALELLTFLDEQARGAPSVEARAALDGFRVSAALAAGDPARALPFLEASERDLPRDYNPPARQAVVLRELGRHDEALAASDRALARAYGPRKLAIYDGRATIFERRGDRAAARAILEEALAYAAALPESQRPERVVARLEKRLAAL